MLQCKVPICGKPLFDPSILWFCCFLYFARPKNPPHQNENRRERASPGAFPTIEKGVSRREPRSFDFRLNLACFSSQCPAAAPWRYRWEVHTPWWPETKGTRHDAHTFPWGEGSKTNYIITASAKRHRRVSKKGNKKNRSEQRKEKETRERTTPAERATRGRWKDCNK